MYAVRYFASPIHLVASHKGIGSSDDLRASFVMNVCGPTIFPIQYPVKITAPVTCFFVKPVMLDDKIFRLMLWPRLAVAQPKRNETTPLKSSKH